jgi:5'/3'-nucleotidase
VVAPALEQSGVAHTITLLMPLVVKQVDAEDGSTLGWMVEGSPADSVKLAICELMARPPDLIISGINSGSNAGINVLYSGTVAAAIEGAFFKITSIAVSLELSEHFDFPYAAKQAMRVIEKILAHKPPNGSLFNVNLPAHSRGEPKGVRVVPMGLGRYGEGFERRQDPRGRTYYWLTYNPPHNVRGPETDVSSLCEGYITVTPLHFDLTRHDLISDVSRWKWGE